MTKRLSYALVFAVVGSFALSACSDDDDDIGGSGGTAGSGAGTKAGGATSGGASSKAGANSGGKAGNSTAGTPGTAGAGDAGAGGAADGGMGGVSDGGAVGNAGAAGSDTDVGGAGGAGGAGEQPLVYACGSNNKIQKLCSALKAADCAEPTDCSDCVAAWEGDFVATNCATCDAMIDSLFQCGVDAFELRQLAQGVECVDGIGADLTIECYSLFDDFPACNTYLEENACPATWPPT